jgi:hypothetical protein
MTIALAEEELLWHHSTMAFAMASTTLEECAHSHPSLTGVALKDGPNWTTKGEKQATAPKHKLSLMRGTKGLEVDRSAEYPKCI